MTNSTETDPRPTRQRIVLITGPAGAGRGTAIKALEDLGYEAIDNLPLGLLARLLEGPPLARPLALGIDPRNRDFATDTLIGAVDGLAARSNVDAEVLFLDCNTSVLLRRFSETRRRHPLAPEETPEIGIARERDLLAPARSRADFLIDTSELSPHDLRAELVRLFGTEGGASLAVSVQSFSFKRGLPAGADTVFDVRFLRNPHWEEALRPRDGRDPAVADFVAADPAHDDFLARVTGLALALLPAYRAEGKTHFAFAFGCTGGRHRSVAVAESFAKSLAADGWRVSIRHRELERDAAAPGQGV